MILFVELRYEFIFIMHSSLFMNIDQVAIMQIPQGMAYALLARLPAMIGKNIYLLNCIENKFPL